MFAVTMPSVFALHKRTVEYARRKLEVEPSHCSIALALCVIPFKGLRFIASHSS